MTKLTAGGAIFGRLKALGVDYVFANSGTDFPPIIEGLAQAAEEGAELPQALTIPHEHVALGMAHGVYWLTGRMQAVMLHTNVGLANGAIGAINASVDLAPVLIMSGRTPVTEVGRFGARTVPIGWGQEMFDQAALVREATKWDYELRFPEQIAPLLDRAAALARSEPKGPVYLSLPREVLCEEVDIELGAAPTMQPVRLAPDPGQIGRLAAMIEAADNPMIIGQRGPGDAAGWDALDRIAADWAIPVSDYWAVANLIRADHPCYIGERHAEALAKADLIIAIDSLAPWQADGAVLRDDAQVVHLGPDPLMGRAPYRCFPVDLAIAAETGPGLAALSHALDGRDRARANVRRAGVVAAAAKAQAAARKLGEGDPDGPLTKAMVSAAIGRAVAGRKATVVGELGARLPQLAPREFLGFRNEPHAGGLGFAFPAALGMKLAGPDRTVVATPGDGSYMFANPVACHQVAEAYGIAPLVVVVNNSEWGAVRQSVKGLYPDGAASRANAMPLTDLAPAPDFAAIARASRAWAERVETLSELEEALKTALAETDGGRLALIDAAVLRD